MYEQYSKKVRYYFMHPKNMGEIKAKDLKKGEVLAIGEVGNPICGDVMKIFLKIKNDKIIDVKVKTFGCIAAIACSSITTEMARGKPIKEAKKISKRDASKKLGGLPPIKEHCSNLAADALHKAIENYEKGVVIKND